LTSPIARQAREPKIAQSCAAAGSEIGVNRLGLRHPKAPGSHPAIARGVACTQATRMENALRPARTGAIER